MSAKKMHAIPYAQFSTEMRSGKIIKIDDGFTKLLGYTEDDVKNGLVFKQFVPDLEYSEIIAELREQFIEKKYACYRHEVVSKTGEIRMIVAFFTIQNKLLNGHHKQRNCAVNKGCARTKCNKRVHIGSKADNPLESADKKFLINHHHYA